MRPVWIGPENALQQRSFDVEKHWTIVLSRGSQAAGSGSGLLEQSKRSLKQTVFTKTGITFR
jgi:hypothetical protein